MLNLKFHANKERKISRLYFLIGAITLILVVLAVFFLNNILNNEFRSVEKYMQQSVMQTASNLNGRITNSINEMKFLSVKLPQEINSYSESEITKFLSKHILDYDYRRLVFAYPSGKTIRVQKNIGKIESTDWSLEQRFIKAISGQSVFATTKREPSAPSGYVNEFGVPVYNNSNEVIGVIGSQVFASNYLKILGFNNYNQKGYSYIIDSNGNFIIKPERDKSEYKNIFDMKLQFSNEKKEKIQQMLKTEEEGIFLFKYKGRKHIASFASIDNPDRMVLTVVPLYVLMLHVDKMLFGLISIVFIISSLLIFLFLYSNKIFKENEKTIYQIAFKDGVTEGGNKNKFRIEARELLEANKNDDFAIISIDLTKFKAINELYGVEKGNKILKDVYEIICRNLKQDCVCARDYAASFVVLYKYEQKEFVTKYFIEKIIDDINLYNETKMKDYSSESEAVISAKLTLTFGVYLISNKQELIDQMCERAYIAKRATKEDVINCYKFYDSVMSAEILQNKAIEAQMYHALNDNQFQMYLQPKFDLQTKELAGAEALVRWIHPQQGTIPPIQFIPLFEKNGFVVELDRCIWAQAAKFLAQRKQDGEKLFPISVNVSRLHLNNDSFVNDIVALVNKYDIEPKYLELELTESACFDNEAKFMEVVKALKEHGFTISMDDFGTGYSSLNLLRHLPIDVLKLDRSFIKDTTQDIKGQIVTRSIVEMANKLNMVTVAEGIEYKEQADFLRSINCKIAQGFLYSKPVNVEEFVNLFLLDRI